MITTASNSMDFTVICKDKTERNAFVTEAQSWKLNTSLAYPNIKDIVAQGKKVVISVYPGDSYKVVRMIRRLGLDIETE